MKNTRTIAGCASLLLVAILPFIAMEYYQARWDGCGEGYGMGVSFGTLCLMILFGSFGVALLGFDPKRN